MRRRRRRNPETSYAIGFALAACAVIGVLYIGKTLGSRELPPPRAI